MKTKLAILAILGLTACGDSATTAPQTSVQAQLVAVTTFEGSKPALFMQHLDGSQKTRIQFTNVRDDIPGNYSGLTVGDANLLALGAPSWDPSGSGRIAVVATLAYDQSEIVVMRPDGTGEVASINTQIISTGPQWSPDGKKLAYTMSTLPGFKGIDLFVTDLTTHTVKRLTTNANLAQSAVRWSNDGQSVLYSKVTAQPTPADDYRNDIVEINVTTGATKTIASNVFGQISSISKMGARVLLTRGVGLARALIEHDFDGTERVLVSDVSYGRYSPTLENNVLVVTVAVSGGAVINTFQVLDVSTKTLRTIAGVSGESNADVYTPYPLD
jgi:dipeptidyl aminopeptidase/acylaminoacyl peptidase